MPANHETAVRFAVSVLRRSNDWQEIQDALANHATVRPYLDSIMADEDDLGPIQDIIREAEERCIADGTMPSNYA